MSLAFPTPSEPETPFGNDPSRPASVSTPYRTAGATRPNPARQAHRQYQQAQIETASPTRLVVLLYDGAIRFCSLAMEAMQAKELETQNTNLIKAQRIIGELMGSLNKEAGGEVAANLFAVYTHLLEQLVQANLYDEVETLESVITVLRELRETWAEVDRMTMQSGGNPAAPMRLPNALGEHSA